MAKRNPNKKKKPPKNKRRLAPAIIVSLIAVVLVTVFVVTKPNENAQPVAPATGFLIETRPVLSSDWFTGKVSMAYKIAAEIPKVLDSQFCYCHCKKEKGHKTLLTCFTSKHGSKCDICINEALYAYELYKQGKTLDDIVVLVDKKFYRPYQKKSL